MIVSFEDKVIALLLSIDHIVTEFEKETGREVRGIDRHQEWAGVVDVYQIDDPNWQVSIVKEDQ